MADLLGARQVFLLVQGASKAAAMKRLFQPRLSPRFPASMLWLHSKVTLFCDESAFRHIASLSIGETNVRINQ
jgi:6-phosphogluconolactonase/glucosamine-6-phosphate isomerase/deaminase